MNTRSHEHSFVERCRSFIEKHVLLSEGERVVVGVSGGVDSVVLLDMLFRLEYPLVVTHVNYGLRGEDSAADERLVRELCERYQVPCRVAHLDPNARTERLDQSLQEAARDQRYAFFGEVADEERCSRVAVAHQKDDQAETVLHNLIRGSGPEGLAGMPVQRALSPESTVQLIRPLLWARRSEVEGYARARTLPWREDVTNEDMKYVRGRLRARVLPCLEEHLDASVVDAIVRSADLLRAYVDHDLRPALDRHFEACAIDGAAGGALSLDYLLGQPPVWRRRIVLEGLARWLPEAPRRSSILEEAEALLESQPGRRLEVEGGTIWRERDVLRMIPSSINSWSDSAEIKIGCPGDVTIPGGRLSFHLLDRPPQTLDPGTTHTIYVDADTLAWPLVIRRWREGDRFQPFGMNGTKLVSDLLTDERVPPHQRKNVLILQDRDGIIWVVGYRMDHRVRVRDATKHFAKITYNPAHSS